MYGGYKYWQPKLFLGRKMGNLWYRVEELCFQNIDNVTIQHHESLTFLLLHLHHLLDP
jgi:hypothetical protein